MLDEKCSRRESVCFIIFFFLFVSIRIRGHGGGKFRVSTLFSGRIAPARVLFGTIRGPVALQSPRNVRNIS